MLDQMLSPIIQSLTRARITVYHAAASLLALATMLSPSLGLSPSDDLGSINSRLIPMWGTPLGVVYRVLDLFNVPLDWIPEVVLYLVENPYRRAANVGAACIISAALMFTLTPNPYNAASVQASTWWVCLAVAAQCGWLAVPLVILVTGTIVRMVKGGMPLIGVDSVGRDIAQLMIVPLLLILPVLYLVFHGIDPANKAERVRAKRSALSARHDS